MSKYNQKINLIVGILLYIFAIVLQLVIMTTSELSKIAKVFLALLPMLPAIWFTKTILHVVSKLDELKKKIIYESAAFSLIATTLITLSYGFLEGFAGLPKISTIWVWPLIGINFIIGKLLSNKHYK